MRPFGVDWQRVKVVTPLTDGPSGCGLDWTPGICDSLIEQCKQLYCTFVGWPHGLHVH